MSSIPASPISESTNVPETELGDIVARQTEGRSRGAVGAGFFSRMLAPLANGVSPFVESLLIMLLALAIGRVFSPADPLFLGAGFPYAWVLPIIIALRYGTLLGVFSAFLMLGGWFAFYSSTLFGATVADTALHSFPSAFFLGGVFLIFIVGHFSDIWAVRMAKANAVNAYVNDRLSVLTRNHFLLKVSHERLENDLLAKPTTLRSALVNLRQATQPGSDDGLLSGAAQFLQFAAHACQLESVALYRLHEGKLVSQPEAEVGMHFILHADDPLVGACLDKKVLVHLQSPLILDGNASDYIACVPLLSGADDLVGILVVKQMPFLSLTQENLQFLLVLAGYYADGIRPLQTTSAILKDVPNCPQDFALDYLRLARMHEEAGVVSTVVALTFGPGDLQGTLCAHVIRQLRALDVSWRIESDDNIVLLVLMPLTGDAALTGYLLRTELSVQEHFGLDFGRAHIGFQSMKINSLHDHEPLKQFLYRVHIHG